MAFQYTEHSALPLAIDLGLFAGRSVEERLASARAAGCSAIELPRMGDSEHAALAGAGIRVANVDPLRSLDGTVERGPGVDRVRALCVEGLSLASAVGAPKITIDASILPELDGGDRVGLSLVREIADDAVEHGVLVVLEGPIQEQTRADPVGGLLGLLARIDRPNVFCGLDLDIVHASRAAPAATIHRVMARLGHLCVAPQPGVRGKPAWLEAVVGAAVHAGYQDVIGIRGRGAGARGSAALPEWIANSPNSTAAAPDQERLDALRALMAEEAVDALICLVPENVVLLSGYWPMNGLSLALLPREGDPTLIVPRGETFWAARSAWPRIMAYPAGRLDDQPPVESLTNLLKATTERLGLRSATIGIEPATANVVPPYMAHEAAAFGGSTAELAEHLTFGQRTIEAGGLLRRARATKTSLERSRLARTAAAGDAGLRAFRDLVGVGLTDQELAAEVEGRIETAASRDCGGARCRAWAYVMSGEQTAEAYLPFLTSTSRPIGEGDLVLLELAVVVDGYWQDLSRTHVAGEPNADHVAVADVVSEAWHAAADALRPGARATEVDAAAREVMREHDLDTAYVHGTGHGVGIAFHEDPPQLVPGSDDVLAEGMVLAIEPGAYVPGIGGIRNEDDCVVGLNGGTPLSTVSPTLDVRSAGR